MLPFAVVILLGFFLLVVTIMVSMYFQHTAEGKRAKLMADLKDKQAARQLVDLEAQVIDATKDIKEARSLLNK